MRPTYANVRRHGSPALPKILAKLPEADTGFPDLLTMLSMNSKQGSALVDALLEGEWLGVLELGDKEEEREHWIVRKVIR
jgi:hypothetical protein